MKYKVILSSLFVSMISFTSSFAAPPTPGDSPPLITDSCATANPDAVLFVPENFTHAVFKSESGGYFYRIAKKSIFYSSACNFYVVDVKMASYSNTQPYPSGAPTEVYVSYMPFDIPGSEAFGDTAPVGMEDCERLTGFSRFYIKKANDLQFKLIETETGSGQWIDNKCHAPASTRVAFPSAGGWDTYRFAVAIKERSSGQEVQVIVEQPPPK